MMMLIRRETSRAQLHAGSSPLMEMSESASERNSLTEGPSVQFFSADMYAF